MKIQTLIAALIITLGAALLAAPASYGGHKWKHRAQQTLYVTAKVIDVEPITRSVRVTVPERECWQEEVRYPVEYRYGGNTARGTLVGGIIGGVIGHNVSHGNHYDRHAAAAVGAVLGANIGRDIARSKAPRVVQERIAYEDRCRVTERHHTEERVDGYRVTYRYQGETFHTRLPYDPGDSIRIRVRVAPVDY